MKCKRCLNEDESWFYKGSKGWYCRKCISFGRVLIEEDMKSVGLSQNEDCGEYTLKYPLTNDQKIIAAKLLHHIPTSDVLVQAVCGAGKTEIVIPTISEYLLHQKKVCFAISRRQVVLEVAERLQSYFKNMKVIAVCGGHTDVLDGDLIVCTCHQLYRYYHAFDLLILDEIDAFPFAGNDVLSQIARTSCVGNIIYLTATPDEKLKQRCEEGALVCLKLNRRPHGKPIPVPRKKIAPLWMDYLFLHRWIKEHAMHPRIIFIPTIRMSEIVGKIFRLFMKCYVCTSKTENRDEVIEQFRKEKNGVMFSTTVLERGVTFPHTDVCVFQANHPVFNEASLIQMAGRAGRDFYDPTGDVLFLCDEKSERVDQCISSIEEANLSCGV